MGQEPYILWFDEVGLQDLPLVGGKNASLGEMRRELTQYGVNVPNGFAVTVSAYHAFLDKGIVQEWHDIGKPNIKENIREILSDVDVEDLENLSQRGSRIRRLIYSLEFPREIVEEIVKAYRKLCKEYGEDTDVAVRSSATAEDLPTASFAGQQETYLNIRGEYALIQACKRCLASLFTNRAISYRVHKGFDHFQVALSNILTCSQPSRRQPALLVLFSSERTLIRLPAQNIRTRTRSATPSPSPLPALQDDRKETLTMSQA